MKWLDKLNQSIEYIENNLEGNIDYEKAAKLACCSTYHFQRMFSYIAGVTLSEYIRNRKMTKAAVDLQNGKKVIDVSLKYGYDSPTAFNRAFKKVHHVSPSAARKEGAFLKSYSPISFKLTIKGVEEMEKRVLTEWLPASGYDFDQCINIEVYLDDNKEDSKFEVWLSVKSK